MKIDPQKHIVLHDMIDLLSDKVISLNQQLAYACGYISGQPKWKDKTAHDVREWIESEVERINKRDKE